MMRGFILLLLVASSAAMITPQMMANPQFQASIKQLLAQMLRSILPKLLVNGGSTPQAVQFLQSLGASNNGAPSATPAPSPPPQPPNSAPPQPPVPPKPPVDPINPLPLPPLPPPQPVQPPQPAPPTPPQGPPMGPPMGPPQGPPMGPPMGPPQGPPMGPPQGPPMGPPQGPPMGPPQPPMMGGGYGGPQPPYGGPPVMDPNNYGQQQGAGMDPSMGYGGGMFLTGDKFKDRRLFELLYNPATGRPREIPHLPPVYPGGMPYQWSLPDYHKDMVVHFIENKIRMRGTPPTPSEAEILRLIGDPLLEMMPGYGRPMYPTGGAW